jgi:hypothetical protein
MLHIVAHLKSCPKGHYPFPNNSSRLSDSNIRCCNPTSDCTAYRLIHDINEAISMNPHIILDINPSNFTAANGIMISSPQIIYMRNFSLSSVALSP